MYLFRHVRGKANSALYCAPLWSCFAAVGSRSTPRRVSCVLCQHLCIILVSLSPVRVLHLAFTSFPFRPVTTCAAYERLLRGHQIDCERGMPMVNGTGRFVCAGIEQVRGAVFETRRQSPARSREMLISSETERKIAVAARALEPGLFCSQQCALGCRRRGADVEVGEHKCPVETLLQAQQLARWQLSHASTRPPSRHRFAAPPAGQGLRGAIICPRIENSQPAPGRHRVNAVVFHSPPHGSLAGDSSELELT